MTNKAIGILAHVDAGKTTLSESILFNTKTIREMGRVDKKNAFLDTNVYERERGITIFSKQAVFNLGDKYKVTLLDTPGHVDFSPEAERTLWALDYAILVVSAVDGVQGHTKTLFELLELYNIPVFIFVNKMDQPCKEKAELIDNLRHELSEACVSFDEIGTENFFEDVAVCSETVMESYLESLALESDTIRKMISSRQIFPVFFGSALKNDGVDKLLEGLLEFFEEDKGGIEEFGARIYKITRDAEGNRLTHIKVTGGSIKVRQILCDDEKVTGIRAYSGEKYEAVNEAVRGGVYALTGLTKTRGGQGLGFEEDARNACLEPVMTYKVILPPEVDSGQMMKKLEELMEEMPVLHVLWEEELKEIHISIMGQVQLEILERLIYDRFGIEVKFGAGRIVYKETIANIVEGVGHFEPLRHYAEVHLKLEPGERGSGVQVFTDASVDELALNWQRLIMTHVLERTHRGVLTGSALTDVKITVLGGRAHAKHTMGGDFRQSTYRAIRQGLMQASSVLLEPYYDFILQLPDSYVGRAMTDLDRRKAVFTGPELDGNGNCTIKGRAPVSVIQDYPMEVAAYSGGKGVLTCSYHGYDICHNADEVILERGYMPEADLRNTPDSVFCYHGAGVVVPWHEVFEHMHVPMQLSFDGNGEAYHVTVDSAAQLEAAALKAKSDSLERMNSSSEIFMGYEEVDAIVAGAGSANIKSSKRENVPGWKKNKKSGSYDGAVTKVTRVYKAPPNRDKYMLVDGYNVIHAFSSLRELCLDNLDGARGALLDLLCNYQAMMGMELIAVFDAYKVKGQVREIEDYHNIHVVYTKEAETADTYIEKFAHENGRKYDITVVTSDGLEQVIIMGAGCKLMSSREFEKEIERVNTEIRENHTQKPERISNSFMDALSEDGKHLMDNLNNDAASGRK